MDEIIDVKEQAIEFLVSSVLPSTIAVIQSNPSGGFEFLGSGFLLKHDDVFFFITAAHVLDRAYDSKLYIPIPQQEVLMPLNEPFLTTGTVEPKTRRDDRLDIGIMRLASKKSVVLENLTYLELDDLDLSNKISRSKEYYILGYPVSKNKRSIDLESKTINVNSFISICSEIKPDFYNKLNVDHRNTLALSFEKKRTVSLDGVRMISPDLNGLSGSPVWGSSKDDKLLVAGILIEHHQGSLKTVLVTRIKMIIDLVNLFHNAERLLLK